MLSSHRPADYCTTLPFCCEFFSKFRFKKDSSVSHSVPKITSILLLVSQRCWNHLAQMHRFCILKHWKFNRRRENIPCCIPLGRSGRSSVSVHLNQEFLIVYWCSNWAPLRRRATLNANRNAPERGVNLGYVFVLLLCVCLQAVVWYYMQSYSVECYNSATFYLLDAFKNRRKKSQLPFWPLKY